MTTETEICNQALGLAGTDNTITSLQQGSEEARNCSLYYNQTRLEVLQAVPWGFSRREVSLSLLEAKAGTPENEDGTSLQDTQNNWNYTYSFPTDCVKPMFIIPSDSGIVQQNYENVGDLRAIQDTIVPFVEGIKKMEDGFYQRTISTNKQSARLVYQADIKQSEFFPPDFVAVLVQFLSSKLCVAIKDDKGYAQYLLQAGRELLQQSKVVHALTFSKDRNPLVYSLESDFLTSRY